MFHIIANRLDLDFIKGHVHYFSTSAKFPALRGVKISQKNKQKVLGKEEREPGCWRRAVVRQQRAKGEKKKTRVEPVTEEGTFFSVKIMT